MSSGRGPSIEHAQVQSLFTSCHLVTMVATTSCDLSTKFSTACTHLIIQDRLPKAGHFSFLYFHEYPVRLWKIVTAKLWKPLSPKCGVYDTYSVIISRDLGVVVCNIVNPSYVVKDNDDT